MNAAGVNVQYRILGSMEVSVDDATVDLGPRKQRLLFALLLINHDRTVTTDAILEALWGDDSSDKENALWVYVSRLRSLLDEVSSRPILVTADRGYRLELGNARLDADEFEEQYRIGSETLQRNATLASTELAKALDPWRGSALEEFRYEQFAQAEIFRLEGLRTACPRFVDPRETTPTRKYAPYVLTSMLKDYDIAVYEAIRSSTEGTSGSSMLFDLANEGIGYSDYTAAIRDVAPVMDAAAQEIMDGTIEVVEWSPIPPAVAWRYEPDVVFDVALSEAGCSLSPIEASVAPGEIIALMLEATNESGGSFALVLLPEEDLSPTEAGAHSVYLPLAIVAPSIPFESRVALPGEPFGSAAIACWPGDVDPWLVDPMAITEPIAITSE